MQEATWPAETWNKVLLAMTRKAVTLSTPAKMTLKANVGHGKPQLAPMRSGYPSSEPPSLDASLFVVLGIRGFQCSF